MAKIHLTIYVWFICNTLKKLLLIFYQMYSRAIFSAIGHLVEFLRQSTLTLNLQFSCYLRFTNKLNSNILVSTKIHAVPRQEKNLKSFFEQVL